MELTNSSNSESHPQEQKPERQVPHRVRVALTTAERKWERVKEFESQDVYIEYTYGDRGGTLKGTLEEVQAGIADVRDRRGILHALDVRHIVHITTLVDRLA